MRPPIALALLFVVATAAIAKEEGRPEGTNCDLSAPPETAGENANRGMIIRIYPRARDITKTYTGCQITLASQGGEWVTMMITEIVEGDPIRLWSPYAAVSESIAELTSCRYRNGRVLSGVGDKCAMHEDLLIKSFTPGCLKKMSDAVAAGGMRTEWPEGCNQNEVLPYPACARYAQQHQEAGRCEEVKHTMRYAIVIEIHLEGLREDGSPIPPPSSVVRYVDIAA